mgnify:CR=1 FL=1
MITYIDAQELGTRINYNARYINDVLRGKCFIEGRHYVRPFGRRKILYIWENIESDMAVLINRKLIPMANGGVFHG